VTAGAPFPLFRHEELRELTPGAFLHRLGVRFQDIDGAGIVFYTRVLEYFHDAWAAFLAASGEPLPRAIAEKRWGAPLRHAEADFLRPLRFGDELEVALVRADVRPTELTVGYRLCIVGQEKPAAVGQTVHAFVDPVSFTRREVPEKLRAAFTALGG